MLTIAAAPICYIPPLFSSHFPSLFEYGEWKKVFASVFGGFRTIFVVSFLAIFFRPPRASKNKNKIAEFV